MCFSDSHVVSMFASVVTYYIGATFYTRDGGVFNMSGRGRFLSKSCVVGIWTHVMEVHGFAGSMS